MLLPEIPEGWAILTLTNGLVIAGLVRRWAVTGSVQVLVGNPRRAVTVMHQKLVRDARACDEAAALAFQAGHLDAFRPERSTPALVEGS